MKIGIIYCYTNKINNKKYIGQTIHPEQRKRNHLHESKKGSDYYFHRALRKYGIDNFIYEVMEECENNLNDKEKFYIEKYNTILPNGYNQTINHIGMPIDIREKISKTKKNKWLTISEEEKMKILNRLKVNMLGKKQTDYQKQKATETNQSEWIIEFPDGRKEKIVNLNKFSKEHGLDQGNMVKVSQGKLKSHKGYKCQKV